MTGIFPWSPRTAAPKAPSVPKVQLVTFRVGDGTYAADVFSVERVLRYEAPRAIVNAPLWLVGSIDYAGRAVPVIDLHARLDVPAAPSGGRARIVIFSVAGASVAAVVDDVHEVATVIESALEDPPSGDPALAHEHVRKVLRRDDGVTVILDVARLLSAQDRSVVDQAMAENGHG